MPSETGLDRLRRLQLRLRRRDIMRSIPIRRLVDRSNPMEHFNAKNFKQRYHMTKDTVIHIVNLIGHTFNSQLRRGCQLPPVLQFLCVLRFYCTGSFQLVIGDYAKMNESTVSRLVRRVSIAIAQLRPNVIRYPSQSEAVRVREDFFRIAGFPGVSGIIDGSLLKIESPGGPNAELFRCRKDFFAINVQGVCDADLNFTNIVARWYGSANDSRIFENSQLGADLESGVAPGLLLGDAGYPLTPFLMTAISSPLTPAERRYNTSLKSTRGMIERTFGIWKRRFPCIRHLRTKLKTSFVVIVATAVLYNISRKRNDIFEEDLLEDGDLEMTEDGGGLTTTTGKTARQCIINSHFS